MSILEKVCHVIGGLMRKKIEMINSISVGIL
jgi:hypothetical protein